MIKLTKKWINENGEVLRMSSKMLRIFIYFSTSNIVLTFKKRENIDNMQMFFMNMIKNNNEWIHLNGGEHECNVSINLNNVFNIQYDYMFEEEC